MSALLNLYDYIFFAFILFFALVGLIRGFWVQFFATLVWLAGATFYYFYSPVIEQVILSKYMSIPVAHWFVLATVLVGCFFINFLTRFLLDSLFKLNVFTFPNQSGGLFFGICSSFMVVLLIIYAVNHSSLRDEAVDWKKSFLVTQITTLIETATFKQYNNAKTSFSTISAINTTDSTIAMVIGLKLKQ